MILNKRTKKKKITLFFLGGGLSYGLYLSFMNSIKITYSFWSNYLFLLSLEIKILYYVNCNK